MNMTTRISNASSEGIRIRGYALTDLMAGASFAEVVHLMLRGELPDSATSRMIEAILVSAVDHGPNAPSIHVARATASCGVPLATAVAAGISAIGTNHGGAGEACARILQDALAGVSGERIPGAFLPGAGTSLQDETLRRAAFTIVGAARESGVNLPGYGHRVYKEKDPRTGALLALAKELGLYGDCARLASLVAEELEKAKGRRLVLNIDGAQAAVLSDLGFSWRQVQPLFIVGRCLGLCAHAAEEIASATPLAYLKAAPAAAEYSGPGPRALPAAPRDFTAKAGTKDES